MEKKTRFADLRHFLEGLGFSETVQPTHLVFEHPASGSLLIFRRYRARDPVTPRQSGRRAEVARRARLLVAAEFDSRMHKAPA